MSVGTHQHLVIQIISITSVSHNCIKLVFPLIQVMDMFINNIRIAWETKNTLDRKHMVALDRKHMVAFLDATFVYLLCKHYPKFSKTKDKGAYGFDDHILESTPSTFERIYIPFFCDKQHRVGLWVWLDSWNMSVIDCYCGLWRESMLKTTLYPFAEMLPYLF